MTPTALLRAIDAFTPAELGAAMHAPAASRMRAALAAYEARIAREIAEDERGRRACAGARMAWETEPKEVA